MRTRVAITGLGVVTGCGAGKRALREALHGARSAIRPVGMFAVDTCRCRSAAEVLQLERPEGLASPGSWRRLDRSSRLLMVAAHEALDEAGLTSGRVMAPFVVATTAGGIRCAELYHRLFLEGGSTHRVVRWLANYLPHRQPLDVQHHCRIEGPVVTLANACAAGADAIGHASRMIRSGGADLVVAGGYDVLCELLFVGFDSLMVASPTLCRPFDRNRDGMILGEAAAILVLESFESARRRRARILGEVSGYGQSMDTHHITQPHPRGDGALQAMRKACASSGIAPEKVDYINAHGTATPQNDAMEATAIRRLLGPRASIVPTSSTKSITGHTLGAAGAVEAVIAVLALQDQFVPPNVNLETPDDECALSIPFSPRFLPLRHVLSNSFGFGGVNASLLLSAA